jgi:hypothetical protein
MQHAITTLGAAKHPAHPVSLAMTMHAIPSGLIGAFVVTVVALGGLAVLRAVVRGLFGR